MSASPLPAVTTVPEQGIKSFKISVHSIIFFKLKLSFSGQYGVKSQNPTLTNKKWTIWIGIASAALLLCFVALVLFLWRKQKKRIPAQLNEDQCPVYGLYYFGDGAQIDDHTSEVVDTNSCYGDD